MKVPDIVPVSKFQIPDHAADHKKHKAITFINTV